MKVWWDEFGGVARAAEPRSHYPNGKALTSDVKVQLDGLSLDAVAYASEEDGFIIDTTGQRLQGSVTILPPDMTYSLVHELGSPKSHYIPGKPKGTYIGAVAQ